MVGFLRLLISHVSFRFLVWACMLDVYYTERWYNMDWLVMIVVCWNWFRICWGGRGGRVCAMLGDEWRGVAEYLMDIFLLGLFIMRSKIGLWCQCKYHTFAASFYLMRIYKIVRVYWVNYLFLLFVLCP
jgi:hypothetical protein